MHDLQKHFVICLCFQIFEKISSLSLCFCSKKKTPLKSKWFSLHCPPLLLLLDSFALCVSSRYVYSSSLLLFLLKIFAKRILCLTVLLRRFFQGKIFLFLVPFSSIEKNIFANNYSYLLFYLFWWKKLSEKDLPYFLWKKFSSFFHHFLFLFITLRIHLCFSFPFLLNLWVFLISFFLNSFVFYFTFFSLNNNNFSFLLFFLKKTFQISILHAWVASWCPFAQTLLQLKKNLFVHFLFFGALFHEYLFLHVCLFFRFFLLLFYSYMFWNIFLFLFSFLNVFLCWSLFIDLFFFCFSVWFDHRFFSPSYSPFFTKKKTMCFELLPFVTVSVLTKTVFLPCWSFWERNVPLCFLFLLVFLFSENLKNNE